MTEQAEEMREGVEGEARDIWLSTEVEATVAAAEEGVFGSNEYEGERNWKVVKETAEEGGCLVSCCRSE